MRNWICAVFTFVFLLVPQSPLLAAEEAVRVEMKTSLGSISLELYPDAAPITVANFLRYLEGHHYDGSSFYRTVRMGNQVQNKVRIEVIQGGRGMLDQGPLFDPIAHESTEVTGILHRDGTISMARLDPGSASSEFFICINDQPELDFGGQRNPDGQGFAAFGRVIQGMDVVRAIQAMKTVQPKGGELEYTSGQMLLEPVTIQSMEVLPHQAVHAENEAILEELNAFWAELARTVTEGDFEAYKATYHEDAVLVSGPSNSSYPVSQALDNWKQGFLDTRAGKVDARVEFRFTQRLNDASTAHEQGIFKYASKPSDGELTTSYLHFEALLIKKGHWMTLMEYQQQPATQAEWEAAQ